MSESPVQADFESIWSEIKLLLDWNQGFGFYLVFGDDHRVSRRLQQRIEDATRLRSHLLQRVRPEAAEAAVEVVLKAAFPEGEDRRFHDWRAPLWIDLTTGPDDQAWEAARQQTLAALNRSRSALERGCPRPLFLQLPEAMAPAVVTWAPDLWSIRQFVAVLPHDDRIYVPAEAIDVKTFREEAVESSLKAERFHQEGALLSALESAREVVERFRVLRASVGDTPQTLRDLSVSLERLGDVELDAGNLLAATAAYRECLELDRLRRMRQGDTPQVLRDLSISLQKLGDVQCEAGNLSVATEAYRESLELCRRLRTSLGEIPQALRDLSISLHKFGDVEREVGNLPAARAAYRESLELIRQLRVSLGDTPQALRDLSISLDMFGDVEREAGNFPAAAAAYRESLELRRQLRASLGDTPQTLRDLSISLDRLGDVEAEMGNPAGAEAARLERQELLAQLERVSTEPPPAPDIGQSP